MIVERVKNAVKKLTGNLPAGREVTVFEDDVFITSYPRSGNTWFRFLVANLKSGGNAGFANLESLIPDIYQNSDAVMRKVERPRVLKSHEAFDARYPRVIYLIRDPRDVVVSYYHFLIKWRLIEDGYPISEFVSRMLSGDLPFGSWGHNVESWLAERDGNPDFVLLRYEDLLADPVRELQKIAPMLGLDAGDTARLERAIALSSADRMRELEKKEAGQWATTRHTRNDKAFVRGASSGGWGKELPPGEVARLEQEWGSLMRRFGYLPPAG
jgi:hypothetical protein